MDKRTAVELVREVVLAPSCCAELKAAAETYLAAIGTPAEREAARNLVAELEEDVSTIDAVLELFESPTGIQIFGAERAKAMAAHARDIKSQGAKFCDCPACSPGSKLLANRSALLG